MSVGTPLPELVLASGSPRRSELLRGLGLRFLVHPADISESADPGEGAEGLVARLSAEKCRHVAPDYSEALVLAADTVVVCGRRILGKPRDAAENLRFLLDLSGREHLVVTGHHLRLGEREAARVVTTAVTFRELTREEIDRYVASGEGTDKAGGYAIQGRGAALVRRLNGCYFNVVGLSLATVVELAAELGVTLV